MRVYLFKLINRLIQGKFSQKLDRSEFLEYIEQNYLPIYDNIDVNLDLQLSADKKDRFFYEPKREFLQELS
jgi:hypothetical protein